MKPIKHMRSKRVFISVEFHIHLQQISVQKNGKKHDFLFSLSHARPLQKSVQIIIFMGGHSFTEYPPHLKGGSRMGKQAYQNRQECWETFWKEQVTVNGELDIEQVKQELFNYKTLLDQINQPQIWIQLAAEERT